MQLEPLEQNEATGPIYAKCLKSAGFSRLAVNAYQSVQALAHGGRSPFQLYARFFQQSKLRARSPTPHWRRGVELLASGSLSGCKPADVRARLA
jgi:hypothetical protein